MRGGTAPHYDREEGNGGKILTGAANPLPYDQKPTDIIASKRHVTTPR